MKNNRIVTFLLRIALILLIIGALFKIMHWPHSKELMFIGGISIAFLYTIRFLSKTDKSRLDFVKLGLVLLWSLGYLIKIFHLYNLPYLIEIITMVLFFWWIIEEGFYYFKRRKFKEKGWLKIIYFILVGFVALSLFAGTLFKIQHWPYGSLIFTIGIFLLCFILVFDYFVME